MVSLCAFDPDEPEGSGIGRTHVSKKDLRNLVLVMLVLLAGGIPVYNQLKAQAHQHTCRSNFMAIGQALALYREENNDRFPPTHVEEPGTRVPVLFDGRPSTWATQTQPYMIVRASFTCPSASTEEGVLTEHLLDVKKTFLSHYGMFEPRGGVPLNALTNPDTAVVVGETSNHGSNETFNPIPFRDAAGTEVPIDGFVIGFDTGSDSAKAGYVTRMAFPQTSDGKFVETGPTRHLGGTQVLFASGASAFVKPSAARVERFGRDSSEIVRFWSVDR